MKFINKQALNITLTAGDNNHTPQADSQIRALTVFNPTLNNVDIVIKVSGRQFVKKTVTPNTTEVINQLFNQQIAKDEILTFVGDGLNVLMTVVEIID